jgi:hypothetical protein
MSAAPDLLTEVRAAGVQLWLDDGKLRIKVPRGALTTVQRDLLTARRAEIAALLAEPANDRDVSRDVPADDLPPDLQSAFDERAAIAELDGGLDREAAERLARQEVTSGPVGNDVTSWRSWMRSRLPVWQARGLSTREAARVIWAEAESAWHLRHPPPVDPDRCAGCGEWMLDGPGMSLLDGAVIHFGNPDRFDCMILHGETWRGAASTALVALGLRKPA